MAIAQPAIIRWDRESFVIHNRPLILFGGSMHYFRIPEPEWESALRRIASDGFNLIDTYVPWSIHEPEEGKFDFGTLERFLALANKYGLYVVARPGPYLCSEFDQGGFPRWLSGKNVGFRSNSEASRRWSRHWYNAVMPVLARNQVSRGGPVVMVQIENEYGHPQYLRLDEKKDYLRFLYQTAAAHGFDVPLMGNDIQFAQQQPDPMLARIFGTVDAYFGSYKELDEMLEAQRRFNPNAPVGTAEYSLAGPEATLSTMLGLGTAYMDLYMFRGGSQFDHAAKGYESSSYVVSAPLEEGGYAFGKYYAMRAGAQFLQQFAEVLARADPVPESPSTNDPELWIKQRNAGTEGFLFLRSDSSGVNDRTLRLETVDRQKIRYVDPFTGTPRIIPQYSTLLLRPHEGRILVLNVPLKDGVTLAYSTAEMLGVYRYPARTWLVAYGDPGAEAEVSLAFNQKPTGVDHNALARFQFSRQDQVVPVSDHISLLILCRDRAYRAQRFNLSNEPALLVSDADEADQEISGNRVTLHLGLRHALGAITVLSHEGLAGAIFEGKRIALKTRDGVDRLPPAARPLAEEPRSIEAQRVKTWPVSSGASVGLVLRSLPEAGIWRKGITCYRANFQGGKNSLRLRFFTDDYHAVYLDGRFVPEASNRALEAWLGSAPLGSPGTMELEIYVVDTGRPKEDLGRWRMDEKKGLESAEWVEGRAFTPLEPKWDTSFAGLSDLSEMLQGNSRLVATEYSFPRPQSAGIEAVWRVHLPDAPGLVYLNGVYLEHHEAGQSPSNTGDRPGVYLPSSMLSENNRLVIVSLEPPASDEPPRIVADGDSVRRKAELVLDFSPARP